MAAVQAPAKAQCLGTTKRNERCSNPPQKGKLFCWRHPHQAPFAGATVPYGPEMSGIESSTLAQATPSVTIQPVDVNETMRKFNNFLSNQSAYSRAEETQHRATKEETPESEIISSYLYPDQPTRESQSSSAQPRTTAEDYHVQVPPGVRAKDPRWLKVPVSAITELEEVTARMIQLLQLFKGLEESA